MKKLCFILLFALSACMSTSKNTGSIVKRTSQDKSFHRIIWTYNISSVRPLNTHDKKTIGETFSLTNRNRCYSTYSSGIESIGYTIKNTNRVSGRYLYTMKIICLRDRTKAKQFPPFKTVYKR